VSPTAAAVRRVAAPYKVNNRKSRQKSRADDIRLYMIMSVCNIKIVCLTAVYFTQPPIHRTDFIHLENKTTQTRRNKKGKPPEHRKLWGRWGTDLPPPAQAATIEK